MQQLLRFGGLCIRRKGNARHTAVAGPDHGFRLAIGNQTALRDGQCSVEAGKRTMCAFAPLDGFFRGGVPLTPAEIRPVKGGWISSRFGRRKSPFTGRPEMHSGYDIAAHKGTKIVATAGGTVSYTGKKRLMGKIVVIDHGNGIVTRYGHCSKILKKKGDSVKRGDVIALEGDTGRSTGPHVHYEVRLNGVAINPERFIFN